MDRLLHSYELEVLQRDSTALLNALELAQSQHLSVVFEAAEAMRGAALESVLHIQRVVAEGFHAAVAAAEPTLNGLEILRQDYTGLRTALELAQSQQANAVREAAEATRGTALESIRQIQREMSERARVAAESALQIQREVAEANRVAEQIDRERDQILRDAIKDAVRILSAVARLRRCRAQVAQIRRLLRLTKNKILVFLRQLFGSSSPINLIVIQESWFLAHGEHPPRLLTVAIPVCF